MKLKNELMKNPTVALLAGIALVGSLGFAAGFQNGSEKIATVDFRKAMLESAPGRKISDGLNNQANALQSLVDYFTVNDVMTKEQANTIKTLTLKENPTEADKKMLEATKQQAANALTEFNSLMEKKEPTQADRDRLQVFAERRGEMSTYVKQLSTDLQSQFDNAITKKQTELRETVKAAVKETATKKGYTVVLDSPAVVYSANEGQNDITEDCIKALNAKG